MGVNVKEKSTDWETLKELLLDLSVGELVDLYRDCAGVCGLVRFELERRCQSGR